MLVKKVMDIIDMGMGIVAFAVIVDMVDISIVGCSCSETGNAKYSKLHEDGTKRAY